MPILLTIGAVAVIATLMVIGIRHRWDPVPGQLPPSSMSVPAPAPTPIPRGIRVLLVAGPGTTIVLVAIAAVTEGRWVAVAGYLVLGLSWGALQTVAIWKTRETRLGRIGAVLQPAALLLGFVAAAATRSVWWVLGGAIVYLGIMPLVDAVERRRGRRSAPEVTSPALHGGDDTRR